MVKRFAILVGLVLALPVGAAAEAAPPLRRAVPANPSPAAISLNDALTLVRTALVALNQANATGNYTVLRDLGSPEFQAVNTAARLSDIFRPLRAQSFDLSGVTVIEPQFNGAPHVDGSNRLHLAGVFPSTPLQIRFDVVFVGKDQRWVVDSLSVALASSAAGPPAPVTAERAPVR